MANPDVSITNLRSVTNGIIAFSGGGQTGGVPLVSIINRVLTVAADHDSVKLPQALAGLIIIVINQGSAAHILDIYPEVGEQIDELGNNIVYTLADDKNALFACAVDGQWDSILSA